MPTHPTDVDVEEYIENNANDIRSHLSDAVQRHRSIRWYATMDIQFYRTTTDGQFQQTTARFRTSPDNLSDMSLFDPRTIARELTSGVENFNRRGSCWIVDLVVDFHITSAPYRPTQGSSYIPTPPQIAKKKATVNVKNFKDDLCFLWSILAGIHPAKDHVDCLYHYKPYLNELNTTGLSFPLKVRDVPKFESQNTHLAVNVLVFEDRQLIPLYSSHHRNRCNYSIEKGNKRHS